MTPLRKAGGGIDRVVPKYLPLNKGESYPPAKFKDASQRELALIELYEGQLIWLRDELRKNRAIRQALSLRITHLRKQL